MLDGFLHTQAEELTLNVEEDNTLLQAYAEGQVDAFNTLYERYRKPLYQFVLHGCSDKVVAAEIFQDIWMSVIQARNQFDGTGTFKSWLYRIARNKLIDFYRKNRSRDHESYEEEAGHGQLSTLQQPLSPGELAELGTEQERVQSAIAKLPWLQRDAVVLKYVVGFSLAEIAVQQGDSIETVKSRLRYAYTKLRQQLRAHS